MRRWHDLTPFRFDTAAGLAQFTALTALFAILADALLGHAILWENDPYWTYWITKTFLIATVFGLGTAWIGVGVARGALITLAHTVVLTVYYWSLSPVGLPAHPSWLDLGHTWVTGLPVHFGVIYLGYLVALWVWRRRGSRGVAADSVQTEAVHAVAVSAAIVAVLGIVESFAIGEFTGVTWFVVRLLITVPFTLVWWAAAGRDLAGSISGGLVLTSILVTYGHFLGPVGLPDRSMRIISQDPPPSTVHWLTYRQEFLVMLPVTALVTVVGYLAVARATRWWTASFRPSGIWAATVVIVVLLVVLGSFTAASTGPDSDRATIESSGAARVEAGPMFRGSLQPSTGELRLVARNRNPRVSPLPPHDTLDLRAEVTGSDGAVYEVTSDVPMVDDPAGRFTTWWGVGFDEWHHGRSGIGSDLVPAVRSEVAVFALGDVRKDGQLVASGVPVHVMTTDMPGARLEFVVGDPGIPVPALPDGHLRVAWETYRGGHDRGGENARLALGSGVLVTLLLFVLSTLLSHDPRRWPHFSSR